MASKKRNTTNNPNRFLFHNDYRYRKEKAIKSVKGEVRVYWICSQKPICKGRIIESPIGTFTIKTDHTCQIDHVERAKDAAIERLRDLTLSVEGSVKAIELVRKVLRELPPEVCALMPSEDSLIQRVTRWARASNIELVKANPEDYLIPEGEEHLYNRAADESRQSTSGGDALEQDASSSEDVVKTGIVYPEPVSGLGECTGKDPSGLIFMKGRVNGHFRAMIEGQSFSWRKSFLEDKFLYACQFESEGCPVTVVIDLRQDKYELRGTHKHNIRRYGKRKKHGAWQNLKRVDEHGNEIGTASLDDFLSGSTSTDWQNDNNSSQQDWKATPNQSVNSTERPVILNEMTGEQDYFMDDIGADDFQADFEPEEESDPLCVPKPKPVTTPVPSQSNLSRVITTSSQPSKKRDPVKQRTKDAVKSGERCFVCGDELIVSETLSCSSEETFRKACCFLNVKLEMEWFPRSATKFYSFCESCTNEITKIHSLYRKVEEIQSLIFRKVEFVEKRIADAEIVDNWMAEAPQTTAARFEGFRKQVMINYRNKLKLRREVRFGNKTGQPLMEIKPGSTARMFATDPADTGVFYKVPSNGFTEHTKVTPTSDLISPQRKTRGRPKSKKPPEERERIQNYHIPEPNLPEFPESHTGNDNEDNVFFDDFNDSQDDAMSVASEREVKFWEEDPSQLEVGKPKSSRAAGKAKKKYNDDDYDDDNVGEDDISNDQSDPDYEDDDDDEDWEAGSRNKRSKSKTPRKTFTIPAAKRGVGRPPLATQTSQPTGPRQILLESKVPPKKKKVEVTKPKSIKKAGNMGFQFPDAVLTKDGRVFMEGIEIIKNPPGAYKPRPYSISFSCGSCSKIVLGFWQIRHHICGHHLGMYKCPICVKEFTDPKIIKRHIAMKHGSPVYENCPICEKPIRIYKSEKTMQYHRWNHLNEEERKDPQYQDWVPPKKREKLSKNLPETKQTFMCGQCGKTFNRPIALRKHELTHTAGEQSDVPLMCQYCGKTFNTKKALYQHAYMCAKKVSGFTKLQHYPCPKCPKRFSTRGTRSKHMRRFHSTGPTVDLPFVCPKCPRSFGTRSGFRNHKRVCIDGEKGHNNKGKSDSSPPPPKPSTSFASKQHETKYDPSTAESSSSSVGGHGRPDEHQDNSSGVTQYDTSSAASASGYNYGFLGNYTGSQFQQHQHHQN